ncbi:type IV pilus biogenesis protein PilM [Aeoliella mucimassa]|uniref:Competence protein A n=1 Tax=Aeoliella mucimassa TaxID=2527972 RepID=A0A518AJ66_9BACT|nr:pilus assembly protein PilM [Aeoliella mucimassa]QDU54772.1 Competence protein A [Aeoliella mucimassa]
MFGRSNHGWIGLDLGANSIKLAQVVRQGDRLRLTEAAIVPRSAPWREHEPITASNSSAANEIGTALVMSSKFRGRQTAAVLPTMACQFNTAPSTNDDSPAQLRAIVDELSPLGIDLSDRVFDYWPSLPNKSGHPTVNVLSTGRGWSELTAGDIRTVGLSCEAIDGLPHTLARSVAMVESITNDTIAAIDWSYTGATFVLLHRLQPVYIRQLKNTSLADAFTQIAEQLDLDEGEVVELLQSVSLGGQMATDVDEVVAELLEPTIASMVDELKRTLSHLENFGRKTTGSQSSTAPKRYYLFGGGATLRGIDKVLQRRAGGEFRVWKLDAENEAFAESKGTPLCLLASAMALSALCWEDLS